jgi:hypothetical protein
MHRIRVDRGHAARQAGIAQCRKPAHRLGICLQELVAEQLDEHGFGQPFDDGETAGSGLFHFLGKLMDGGPQPMSLRQLPAMDVDDRRQAAAHWRKVQRVAMEVAANEPACRLRPTLPDDGRFLPWAVGQASEHGDDVVAFSGTEVVAIAERQGDDVARPQFAGPDGRAEPALPINQNVKAHQSVLVWPLMARQALIGVGLPALPDLQAELQGPRHAHRAQDLIHNVDLRTHAASSIWIKTPGIPVNDMLGAARYADKWSEPNNRT